MPLLWRSLAGCSNCCICRVCWSCARAGVDEPPSHPGLVADGSALDLSQTRAPNKTHQSDCLCVCHPPTTTTTHTYSPHMVCPPATLSLLVRGLTPALFCMFACLPTLMCELEGWIGAASRADCVLAGLLSSTTNLVGWPTSTEVPPSSGDQRQAGLASLHAFFSPVTGLCCSCGMPKAG